MQSVNSSKSFKPPRVIHAMVFIILWISAASPQAAEMITHPGVAIQSLTVNVARSMFGMRQVKWPDGTPVRVFVLPEQNSLHAVFCREMLNIYPYQLQQSWNRLVYSGTGQAPTEVSTEQEMLSRVAATPGAIGYINKVNSDVSVHTISVR